ncbi:hypothetical protein DRH29_00795 [candidate division Kazan bacterium]|uniref:LysM domain-containing protein n=1 Tax=candidate division Kazan bacterium TaxID=2202143 RepID=A0A420ZE25_UNCK3|nr:MAG: hypothetical protein DRH29_00795 [candidate division Kazan bacterium]
MAKLSHKIRRYGYRTKQRFKEDPFSVLILYALFFSAVFLIFAFRGLIATIFIKPIGVINSNDRSTVESVIPVSTDTEVTKSEGNDSEPIILQSTGIYTVKSGDTLAGIGADLNIDWKDLAELNGIEAPYSLSVGQELKLPEF